METRRPLSHVSAESFSTQGEQPPCVCGHTVPEGGRWQPPWMQRPSGDVVCSYCGRPQPPLTHQTLRP